MAGEKRSAAESETEAQERHESAILIDVEGTTSSISFVKDTLFPYVRESLKKHVDDKWDTEEFKADFAALKKQAKEDEETKVDGFVPITEDTEESAKESLIKNILWQMDNDRKSWSLKQFQGHVWKAAYKPIKGHVYDDVPKAFEEWTNDGKQLYIFSSGSVEAQKLLFGNSVHGDLLKYLSGHFDTEVGPKQEAESYKNILKKLNFEPSKVLFLTDVIKEAEAAKAAGLSTLVVVREGNTKLSDEEKIAFKTIESFEELSFQNAKKRPKLEKDSLAEKIDVPKEEKLAVTNNLQPVEEPMDTSDNVENVEDKQKSEKKTDVEQIEANIEKTVVETKTSNEKVEKEITPAEKDTNSEEKTAIVTKTELEKSEVVSATETKDIIEKEVEKTEQLETSKKLEEVEKKSEKIYSISEEKSLEAKEKSEVKEVTEKVVEEVSEKMTEATTEKMDTENVDDLTLDKSTEKVVEKVEEKVIEKEAINETNVKDKLPEKTVTEEIKENGDAKITPDKVAESIEKVDDSENKENVESVEVSKPESKVETDVEITEEVKETAEKVSEEEKETEEKLKDETETKKDTQLNGAATNGDSKEDVADKKVQSNGVSEESKETKENGDTEESIKVKKTVPADGAGEPDVVSPPVVAATS